LHASQSRLWPFETCRTKYWSIIDVRQQTALTFESGNVIGGRSESVD
jgi:hypothetical protein